MVSEACSTNRCSVFPVRDYASVNKSHFYVSTNDDYNMATECDFEEFTRGINILQELADNGIISGEEETRRKVFLKQYMDYQKGFEATALSFSPRRFCSLCLAFLHALRDYCAGFAYYTDAED
jgi:hypothetical protein